jgi:hypothetical protein
LPTWIRNVGSLSLSFLVRAIRSLYEAGASQRHMMVKDMSARLVLNQNGQTQVKKKKNRVGLIVDINSELNLFYFFEYFITTSVSLGWIST